MTWYAIKDGQQVLRVVEQAQAPAGQSAALLSFDGLPQGGGPGHELREAEGVLFWQDVRTLQETKAARVAAMRDARDAHINSTFTWDGSEFDADQVSQSRLLGAAWSASRPGFVPTPWRLADNSWRVLDAEDTAAVYGALEQHLRAAFLAFAEREAEIAAAESVAEVDAVKWI